MKYKINLCVIHNIVLFLLLCNIPQTFSEYISIDEPSCREDCYSLTPSLQEECLTTQMEFYSYKMIKGIFNYGKTAIYAGLWTTRYEKANDKLFEDVFNEVLKQYNNEKILGGIAFEELENTTRHIFDRLRKYSDKPEEIIEYGSYPSLQCPSLCNHEVTTWQIMFYLSLAIFILSAITISLYSIFLRKQYDSLKSRLKVMKYSTN